MNRFRKRFNRLVCEVFTGHDILMDVKSHPTKALKIVSYVCGSCGKRITQSAWLDEEILYSFKPGFVSSRKRDFFMLESSTVKPVKLTEKEIIEAWTLKQGGLMRIAYNQDKRLKQLEKKKEVKK